MATYQEVMDALRAADAAGATEDATRLAEIASKMRDEQGGSGGGRGGLGGPALRPAEGAEYFGQSIIKGLTRTPAQLTAGQAQQQGTFAGAFPTQPELAPVSTESVQQLMGAKPEVRPASGFQRFFGAGLEASVDPLTLFGGPAKPLQLAGRMMTGGASGVGAEFGGDVGGQVAGVPGQVFGGIVGALLTGAPVSKGASVLVEKGVKRLNPKDFNLQDIAEVEGLSKAQDLIETAIKNDPDIMRKLRQVQERIQIATGEKGALAVAALDDITLRTKMLDLAKTDAQFATQLNDLYATINNAVRKRAGVMYPEATGNIPSVASQVQKVENTAEQRVKSIDAQLDKITQNLGSTSGVAPVEVGKAIQSLVLAKEKSIRSILSPEYDSLREQASKQGALLPADQTESLLKTAKDLFMQDPWARQSDLMKLVNEQYGKFRQMRAQAGAQQPGALAVPGADRTMGMDITSLDSLKKRVAKDIREVTDPNRRDKLRVLQQRVDDAMTQLESNSGAVNVNFRGENMSYADAMKQLDLDYYQKIGVNFRDASAIQKIGTAEYAEKIGPLIASKPTDLAQFLKVAGDEGVPIAQNAIMSRIYNKALNPDGSINQIKLQNLLNKNSNAGGFSDLLDQLPELKAKLADASTNMQYLTNERIKIVDASNAERTRLGESFLKDYEASGVDGVVNKMLGATGKGYRASLNSNLSKLNADDRVNAIAAIKSGMVSKMLDQQDPFKFLEKNKVAFVEMFGKTHYENLMAMADTSRLARKINIDNLPIQPVAVAEASALKKMIGIDPSQLTGILVNQIASVFNKGFRILAKVGQANIDQATKDAHKKLFLDPNGLELIKNANTKILTRKGQEVDVKQLLSKEDLKSAWTAMMNAAGRSGYIGSQVGMSPSEVMSPEDAQQPYYQYTGQ